MKRYRIGIVGCGGIAHAHISGYREVAAELSDVVAACDPNEQTLNDYCDQYGLALRFTSPSALIDSGGVDVIALLAPPQVRHQVIVPAAERGIHLLVEKPFGETFADATGFVAAAERASIKLAVNHQMRFMRDALACREIIAAGRIGELRAALHEHYCDPTRVPGWRANEERLEISIFSIHLIDRMQWLVGREPVAVTGLTRRWNPDVRGETFTSLVVEFAGDVVGTVISNWHATGLPECRLRIDGTDGSVLAVKENLTGDACTLTVQQHGGEAETRDLTQPNAFCLAMGESVRQLLLAIESGAEPPHSGRDNLRTMAIVDAAYRSASRGGGRVEIAELQAEAPKDASP